MTARIFRRLTTVTSLVIALASAGSGVRADVEITAFLQSVAVSAAGDRDIAAFYRETGYKPIWTGDDQMSKARREAFLRAIEDAPAHGLPVQRYDPDGLSSDLRHVTSERELGRIEVEMSRLFLRYARELQTGLLVPGEIDPGIVREVPYRKRSSLLSSFASASSPSLFFRQLPPQSHEYARLMKEKMRFEELVARGGWGPEVRARKLEPGDSGPAVVQLRNRLIAMGYLPRTATASYDSRMTQAVAQFQEDHGLVSDGVAGDGTLGAINISAKTRLGQIMVAMERERWTNMPRGKRHVLVNITDFHAQIVDDGKVTFETRSVVGHRDLDRRTPEFSDMMEHLVLNPTWNVPRSIATKEYLPMLQRNPNAAGHLMLVDRRGRIIPRELVEDFTQFDANTFPFDMKQPPSRSNALGLVKFMFPNRHNIYLHDTPQKNLFGREARAFSHGCIRLNDPFDFAYALLARQVDNPEEFFQSKLATRRETQVDLEEHVPVHLIYRTAFTRAKGKTQFRTDVYGRDARIWRAMEAAGVSLPSEQS
ncbi:MAG: L,D-transpeptidase family protein [Silicimonas sp.]|nr:L,D-transpeptidase family protein [Silicimonas sp.]